VLLRVVLLVLIAGCATPPLPPARPSNAVVGKMSHQGNLSAEAIEGVMGRVIGQIEYCYQKELQRDPNLAGTLSMTWTISPSGDVVDAGVQDNTFEGPAAEAIALCAQRILLRLRFPSPTSGSVQVLYPVAFKP
jgi:hypothetical protein